MYLQFFGRMLSRLYFKHFIKLGLHEHLLMLFEQSFIIIVEHCVFYKEIKIYKERRTA